MNSDDRAEFKLLLEEAGACYGKEIAPLLAPYWRNLSGRMSIETMRGAIDAHMVDDQRGQYFPRVSDILHQIRLVTEQDGRPDADEAWSLCLLAFDEDATVCVNDEIMQAKTAADPVMESGDKVGARMAFRATYERIVAEARGEGRKMHWWMSLGQDMDRRKAALLAAVDAKRLTDGQVKPMLPPPPAEGPAAAIAGLLAGKVVSMAEPPSEVARQHIAKLKKALGG